MSKIGRNQPCPCGSGKKYKNCCLIKDREKQNQKTDITKMNDLIIDNPSIKKCKEGMDFFRLLEILTKLGLFDDVPDFNKEELLTQFNQLDELEEMLKRFEIPDKFNNYFQERGWIAFERMNFNIMEEAVNIASEQSIDIAEDYLVESFSKDLEFNIRFLVMYPEELAIRKDLINLAYEDYKSERYYSCVMLLLSIIDGFVADSKIASGKGFYSADNEIYSWDSIASHKSGLNQLQKLIYSNRGKTNLEEIKIPYRNGIMHGRDLNYNNKYVATKLWATLFALKDGILNIKNKGRNPPEKKEKVDIKEVIQKYEDNQKKQEIFKKDSDKWKNRCLKVNIDFKDSQDLNDFERGTPEYALVQFFNYWLNKNFGNIAKMDYSFVFEELNIKNEAGHLRRDIFNNKNLISFKILEIKDGSMLHSNIMSKVVIDKDSELIEETLEFRLVYECGDKNELPIRSLNNGSWKIANFSNIKYKIKRL